MFLLLRIDRRIYSGHNRDMTNTQNTTDADYLRIYGFARPVRPTRTPAQAARRRALIAAINADRPEATVEARPTHAEYMNVGR